MKASIVIANYNSAKFIEDCINSLKSQTYKNIEIIFFDDNSHDNSLEIIEKYKEVKVVKNKSQTNFGSLNQINAFKKAIELSSGDIIFLLDSDDYFHQNKIKKIIDIFLKDNEKMIIFDFPILFKENEKILTKGNKKKFNTYWGYIHPTSCISIRKNILDKVFNSIMCDGFNNIWLDFRILLYSKYLHNYNIIDENLTYYRQTENNISSGFKKYTKNWWKRRKEAHDYFFYFINKNNLKIKKNLDFYFTKFVNKLIQ